MSKQSVPLYSEASVTSLRAKPGRVLVSSEDAGWTSLLLHVIELPDTVETFETLPSPDHLVAIVKSGVYDIESSSGRSFRKSQYRPGRGGLTAAMNFSRLRWSSSSCHPLQSVQMFLPAAFVEEAAEEYRLSGSKARATFPDTLAFQDPVIAAIVLSLADEIKSGTPDIAAEAAARYLASRLLLGREALESSEHLRRGGVLTDSRLVRVVSLMEERLSSPIGLEELASEAAMSPFHFSRVFRAKIGLSPAAYLSQLRMNRAEKLLKETDLKINEIARQCGFVQSGHFAAAFRKRFQVAPLNFRARHFGNKQQKRDV